MAKLDEIEKELAELEKEGPTLLDLLEETTALSIKYQNWYTHCLSVIRQLAPERLDDFVSQYSQPKRKAIDASTYTCFDFLCGLSVSFGGSPSFDTKVIFQSRLVQQISIVKATRSLAKSRLRDIRTELQSELLDENLDTASFLLKSLHLRSAGVVAGVVLESHLKSVAQRRSISLKPKANLSDLNGAMKENNVYDIALWRLIQHLTDLRNLCCHKGDRNPKVDEVEDLIRGVSKVTKEIT